MPNFTPGPWDRIEQKEDRLYIGTAKKPIADICTLYGAESDANLALIAAAPDMYKALDMARTRLWGARASITERSFDSLILTIEKAMAKAEGVR